MSLKIIPKYLWLCVFISIVGCAPFYEPHPAIFEQEISREELPESVSQTFMETSLVSLSNIMKVQTRTFKNEITHYLITYECSDKEVFIMSILPDGQLILNTRLQEWKKQ